MLRKTECTKYAIVLHRTEGIGNRHGRLLEHDLFLDVNMLWIGSN